ncbi:MAG: hypothetical protein LBE91_06720 [Tannerella sp.]|jgi:hypothetical protein|nr:hypothetical protein [Tannerella sp.]
MNRTEYKVYIAYIRNIISGSLDASSGLLQEFREKDVNIPKLLSRPLLQLLLPVAYTQAGRLWFIEILQYVANEVDTGIANGFRNYCDDLENLVRKRHFHITVNRTVQTS